MLGMLNFGEETRESWEILVHNVSSAFLFHHNEDLIIENRNEDLVDFENECKDFDYMRNEVEIMKQRLFIVNSFSFFTIFLFLFLFLQFYSRKDLTVLLKTGGII